MIWLLRRLAGTHIWATLTRHAVVDGRLRAARRLVDLKRRLVTSWRSDAHLRMTIVYLLLSSSRENALVERVARSHVVAVVELAEGVHGRIVDGALLLEGAVLGIVTSTTSRRLADALATRRTLHLRLRLSVETNLIKKRRIAQPT
jgi:hypothetical protein